MIQIKNKSFGFNSYIFLFSRMFERAGFYAFRSTILIYLVYNVFKHSATKGMELFALIMTSIYLANLLGGFIGDFILGNRRSILVGGLIQTAGLITICFSGDIQLYIGLFFILLGTGLYSPNLISEFGKQFTYNPQLLKSGFFLLYLFVNLGSLFGILLSTLIFDKYGYILSFVFAGLMMTFGAFITLLVRKSENIHINKTEVLFWRFSKLKILAVIFISALFTLISDCVRSISSLKTQSFTESVEGFRMKFYTEEFNLYSVIFLSITLTLVCRFLYLRSSVLIFVSFICLVFGIFSIMYFPQSHQSGHYYLFMLFLVFITLAETIILPVLQSLVIKYGNQKFLATSVAWVVFLSYLLSHLLNYLISYFGLDILRLDPKILITVLLIFLPVMVGYIIKSTSKKII